MSLSFDFFSNMLLNLLFIYILNCKINSLIIKTNFIDNKKKEQQENTKSKQTQL